MISPKVKKQKTKKERFQTTVTFQSNHPITLTIQLHDQPFIQLYYHIQDRKLKHR